MRAKLPSMDCHPPEKCSVWNVLAPLISVSAMGHGWVNMGETSRPSQCESLWLARGLNHMVLGCFSYADEMIHPYIFIYMVSM